MKKYLLLFSVFLVFGNGFSKNIKVVKDNFTEISVTLNDGQIKSGKIKHPFDLNKKIEIISESGTKEKIDNSLINEVELKNENGVNLKFKNIYYKNALSEKRSKKPRLMLVIMKELLTLYYDDGISYTSISMAGRFYQTSYSSYYAQREGEEIPTLISFFLSGDLNANNAFRKSASKYFEDYPELSKKITDKVYKYNDILTVCMDYINWKKAKN